jgi:ATP-binding cassette subfamily F protein uup
VAAKKAASPAVAKPRKLKWKEERELESIESVILEAESKVARLEEAFAAPDFYTKHGDRWQEMEAELAAARARVTQLYARWAELEELQAAAAK